MRSHLLAAALMLGAGGARAEPPATGGQELSDEDLDKLDAPGPGEKAKTRGSIRIPTEHDYDLRLLVLPALLVVMLGWNVKWKKVPKKK